MTRRFMRDDRGSAVQWFVLSAVVLSAASMAGAHGLAWLTQGGHLSVVAAGSSGDPSQRAAAGIDQTPTGSIAPQPLLVRVR